MNAVDQEVLELLRQAKVPMGTADLYPLCDKAGDKLDVSRSLHGLTKAGMIRLVATLPPVGRGSAKRLYEPVPGAEPPKDGRKNPRVERAAEDPAGLDPFEVAVTKKTTPAQKPKPSMQKRPTQIAAKPQTPAPAVAQAAPCPPPWPGALDISASLDDAVTASADAMLAYADAVLTEDPRWWALRQLHRAAASAQREMGGRD